jgi:4-alpha-glucanotransferase
MATTPKIGRRASGILLPISALPSHGGIGDLGPEAYHFVDWLAASGQRYWNILPLSIPDSTGSPYASLSSAAGNWLNISGELLQREGLVSPNWRPSRRTARVGYRTIWREKWRLVRDAHQHFVQSATPAQRRRYADFQHLERGWLSRFSLFQALKDRYHQQPWWLWPTELRRPETAERVVDRSLQRQRELHTFAQWIWSEQWTALKRYAHRHSIQFIGDMPFYIRADSVNVWSHRELFLIDDAGQQTVVAGVPPDAFSRDGQRWGNPLYNWPAHRRQQYHWWIERFRVLHNRVDVVRFDHFRGLVHTWHVPAGDPHARHGRWVASPGREVLRAVKRAVPGVRLIAEDLGAEKVGADDLRRAFHAPTIRVLQFGWNGLPNNPHDPQVIDTDAVYYTSNHDLNTTVGWWRTEARSYERATVRKCLRTVDDIAWQSIGVAMSTPAHMTIIPIQDVLRLGSAARYNRPGRRRGNWAWRLRPEDLTLPRARQLRSLTRRYGR